MSDRSNASDKVRRVRPLRLQIKKGSDLPGLRRNSTMKVLLLHDIEHHGKQGEIVNVSEGYARNYLFPRKLAVEATGGTLKAVELKHALEERRAERLLQDAEKTAAQLSDKVVTLKVRAGENNRLYGRVTAADIVDA